MNWIYEKLYKVLGSEHFYLLTDEDQLRLDPTGKGRAHIRKLLKANLPIQPTPQSPDTLRFSTAQWFEWYDEFARKSWTEKHHLFWEYDASFRPKQGPQGGTVPMSVLADQQVSLYTLAKRDIKFDVTRLGFRKLLSMVLDLKNRVGVPQPVEVPLLHTAGGLPSMSKKGTFQAETTAQEFQHLYPDLPGSRFQFQKMRGIHMDATGNVRQVEELLARVRRWLTRYLPQYFGSWRNPKESVAPVFTEAVVKRYINVEGDYKAMDEHYSKQCAELVLPLYEVLLSPSEFQLFSRYITECFSQPIYYGNFLLVGLHNLLSGLPITQDFETVYSVSLHLGADALSGQRAVHLLAIGDDSAMLYARKDKSAAADALTIIEEESALNGCEMSAEKCRFDTPDYRYCRRQWYAGLPMTWYRGEQVMLGAYPLRRVLNNIVRPERASKPEVLVAAQLQRCDNAVGTPNWHQFVDGVYSRTKWELPMRFSESGLAELHEQDWWARVYGERWDPQVSPTYCYLTNGLR